MKRRALLAATGSGGLAAMAGCIDVLHGALGGDDGPRYTDPATDPWPEEVEFSIGLRVVRGQYHEPIDIEVSEQDMDHLKSAEIETNDVEDGTQECLSNFWPTENNDMTDHWERHLPTEELEKHIGTPHGFTGFRTPMKLEKYSEDPDPDVGFEGEALRPHSAILDTSLDELDFTLTDFIEATPPLVYLHHPEEGYLCTIPVYVVSEEP